MTLFVVHTVSLLLRYRDHYFFCAVARGAPPVKLFKDTKVRRFLTSALSFSNFSASPGTGSIF